MSRNSFYVFRRLTLWMQCELTFFFFSGFHFYKGILFFGTVLDLQKNWKDSTASSWIACTPISIFISHISVSVSLSVMPDSLRPHGLQSTRLLCPWDPPGKDTGVGCHFLLQGILLLLSHFNISHYYGTFIKINELILIHYYYLKLMLSSDFLYSTLELIYHFHHIMSRVHALASFILLMFITYQQ